ncbi:MAG: DUF1963 domain-containing protein, partial [Aphanizomenon sp.]
TSMSASDYRFRNLVKSHFPIFQHSNLTKAMEKSLEELVDDFINEYEEKYEELLGGHCLGGYPAFVQNDDRADLEEEEGYDFLLLQMNSDDEHSIMWGDEGVGNFFIQPSALKQLDFSKILYTYACC